MVAGRFAGDHNGDETYSHRKCVREHMSGIADQGNAVGEHAADYFYHHHGRSNGEREEEFLPFYRPILKQML